MYDERARIDRANEQWARLVRSDTFSAASGALHRGLEAMERGEVEEAERYFTEAVGIARLMPRPICDGT